MTPNQIETYEHCRKQLSRIKRWEDSLIFKLKQYDRDSPVLDVERKLAWVHNKLVESIQRAFDEANESIQNLINKT